MLCDNFFASVAGPSYPNHLYMIAGQAGGAIDNPENIKVKQLNDGRAFKSWGCDAYGDDVFVYVEDEQGAVTQHSTCFDMKTVGHQLSKRDIDWAYYSADPYQAGYIWQAYSSIEDVFHDDELWERHIWPVDDLHARHRGRGPAARSRGSRHGSSSPTTPRSARGTHTTG